MTNAFSLNSELTATLQERYANILNGIREATTKEQQEFYPDQVPSLNHIRALIEVSFWASLKKEEGRHHKFSITFSPAPKELDALKFDPPLPFKPEEIAKLSPALENQGAAIGVWPNEDGNLVIWGFTRSASSSLLIEVHESGQLLASFCNEGKSWITGSGIAFIDHAKSLLRKKLLNERQADPTQIALSVITHQLGIPLESKFSVEYIEAVKHPFPMESDLKEIAKSMIAHKHGGTLLVVPTSNTGIKSIDQKKMDPYEKVRDEIERRDAFRKLPPITMSLFSSRRDTSSEDAARRALQMIGQLTSVDGATLVTFDLTVLAFGVKIKPINSGEKPDVVIISEPFEGDSPNESKISSLGRGTRHLSAAQFVFDQKDSIALVASQDGRFSEFAWDAEEQKVAVLRHAELAFS